MKRNGPAPRRPKHRVLTVRLDQETAQKVERRAERNYRTVSQELRRMIDTDLDNQARK